MSKYNKVSTDLNFVEREKAGRYGSSGENDRRAVGGCPKYRLMKREKTCHIRPELAGLLGRLY